MKQYRMIYMALFSITACGLLFALMILLANLGTSTLDKWAFGPRITPLSRSIAPYARPFQAQGISRVEYHDGTYAVSVIVHGKHVGLTIGPGSFCQSPFLVDFDYIDAPQASGSSAPSVRQRIDRKAQSYQEALNCIQQTLDRVIKSVADGESLAQANESSWTAAELEAGHGSMH